MGKAMRDIDPIEMEKITVRYRATKGAGYDAKKTRTDLKREDWRSFCSVARRAMATSTYVYNIGKPKTPHDMVRRSTRHDVHTA